MGTCWIDEFLQDHDRRLRKVQEDAELEAISVAHADEMFLALHEQVSRDVAKYAAASSAPVTFETSASAFLVAHAEFPIFAVEARLDTSYYEGPAIWCREGRKLCADAVELFRDCKILIIAHSQDVLCYRMGGEDYATPEKVSEGLLRHLFESLAPQF